MNGQRQTSRIDFDIILFGATLGLILIGILFIYSSGVTADGVLVSKEFVKQIIWAALGAALLALFAFIDYNKLRDYSLYIYGFFIIILVYTRLFGRVVNGARAWIGIGDVGIQPSEFMKIATILYLARFLDQSRRTLSPLPRFAIAAAITGLPVVLILSQPDFGTSLVFIPIMLFMCLMGGIELRYIAFTAVMGSVMIGLTVAPLWNKYILKDAMPLFAILSDSRYSMIIMAVLALIFGLALWGYLIYKKRYYYWINYVSAALAIGIGASFIGQKLLKEYQIMRLIVFLDPYVDPGGSGWNIIQSMTAIGAGSFFGKGFLLGTQSHYHFLPQQSTDFIFSIISEEIGFFGSVGVFFLFFIIMRRCFLIMKNVHEQYGVLLASGVLAMIFFHFMINVGMAMGIMPITGIPLFFLSYGGSSLWAAMCGIGLILSVYARRFRH
jgi:rod shape determining protein RodA